VRESEVVFVSEMLGVAVARRVTASVSVTAGPVGGVPVTDAEFVSEPASTSACVPTYENWHDVVAAGARVTAEHVPTTVAPARPSDI
jgi:hypothetical protein